MKRIFDILASFVILAAFSPIGMIISVGVLLSSKGGVFYIQERIGKDKQPFGLLKFRTMGVGSDKKGKLTVGTDDIRITSIGRILRKFKLDEFPQFINVLIGQMSIVGPRPEVKEYVELYTNEQLDILKVKPGITDLASLEYFNENELLGKSNNAERTYIEEVMPAKIALNKKYLANPSLLTDIKIMWRTFLKVIGA